MRQKLPKKALPSPASSFIIAQIHNQPLLLTSRNQEVLNFQNDLLLSCFSSASFEVFVLAVFETEEGGGNGGNKADDDEEEADKDFNFMDGICFMLI